MLWSIGVLETGLDLPEKGHNIYLQYAEAHLTHAKWQNLSNPYDGFTSTV